MVSSDGQRQRAHPTNGLERELDDKQQHTAAGRQTQHFGREACARSVSARADGDRPLYSAPKPSSRAMTASEGTVQLYLGACPGTFGLFWIRDCKGQRRRAAGDAGLDHVDCACQSERGACDAHGVLSAVPTNPPIAPPMKLLRTVAISTGHRRGRTLATLARRFGDQLPDLEDAPEVAAVCESQSERRNGRPHST